MLQRSIKSVLEVTWKGCNSEAPRPFGELLAKILRPWIVDVRKWIVHYCTSRPTPSNHPASPEPAPPKHCKSDNSPAPWGAPSPWTASSWRNIVPKIQGLLIFGLCSGNLVAVEPWSWSVCFQLKAREVLFYCRLLHGSSWKTQS